jgi:hypothetical protein
LGPAIFPNLIDLAAPITVKEFDGYPLIYFTLNNTRQGEFIFKLLKTGPLKEDSLDEALKKLD